MALTEEKIKQLNEAAARIRRGQGSATDRRNLEYAKSSLGYVAPKLSAFEKRLKDLSKRTGVDLGTISGLIPSLNQQKSFEQSGFYNPQGVKALASEQFDPYYQKTEQEFRAEQQRKRQRILEDFGSGNASLGQEERQFRQNSLQALRDRLKSVNEGYASRGLAFSGLRTGEVADVNQRSTRSLNDYLGNLGLRRKEIERQKTRGIQDTKSYGSKYLRNLTQQRKVQKRSFVQDQRSKAFDRYLRKVESTLGLNPFS